MSVKVLFVDDDPANLVVCEAACGDDFEVVTASSAEAAMELMRTEEVGVIVADQRMPGPPSPPPRGGAGGAPRPRRGRPARRRPRAPTRSTSTP